MVRNENVIIQSLENYPKNCKSLLNCVEFTKTKSNFIKIMWNK